MLTGLLALASVQLATPQLEPMAFLVGHCWQGEFQNGRRDTHCFEPAQGGRFIRDTHEVTGGYAGETLYSWNAEAGRVEYVYWATSGGVSRGSMTPRGDVLDFGDEVHRGGDGREIRISTTWHRIGDYAYEARITSANDPTGSRVVRYTRLDRAPVRMDESTAADGTRTLVHEVVVPAPPEEVFNWFVRPELLVRWIGIDADLDPRPGGRFRFEIVDGEWCSGRYLEVVPGRRVVFTWGWDSGAIPVPPGSSTVTVDLLSHPDGTLVRLVHSDLAPEVRRLHAEGWSRFLPRLAAALT